MIFVLIVASSIGAACAGDLNATDSDAVSTSDETSVNGEAAELLSADSGSVEISSSPDSGILSDGYEIDNGSSSRIDPSKTIVSKDVTKYYKGNQKYSATFLDENGSALANVKVKITLNGKNFFKTTDSRGIASVDINLKPGTYKVTATNPATGYSASNTVKVMGTIVSADMGKVYGDSSKFTATFLKSDGKPLAKKAVKFRMGKKTYRVKTNSKGVASISLKKLSKGTHKIISYSPDGLKKTNRIKVVGSARTSLKAGETLFLKKETKRLKVRLTDQFGHPVSKSKKIQLTVNGKRYTAKTNKNGVATFKLPALKAGIHKVKYSFTGATHYKKSSLKGKVTVIPTKYPTMAVSGPTEFVAGQTKSIQVAISSGKVPLANKMVTFTLNGKSFSSTTNAKGIASLPVKLDAGNYTLKYSVRADSKLNAKSGTVQINVIGKAPVNGTAISIKNVIAGAKTIRSYYAVNGKLPSAVNAGSFTFTVPEFLYVMSEAIVNLNASRTDDVTILTGLGEPSSPDGDNIEAVEMYRKDYVNLAVKAMQALAATGKAPDHVGSPIGNIIYYELVDAFSRILASYESKSQLPDYCVFTYVDLEHPVSLKGTGLNQKNTVKDTSIYLKDTSNCQVGNSKIKSLVRNLTNDSSTKMEEAIAMYNYVRDSISFSVYYDTKYGAVGTYNSQTGNAVDQSHLLIAMLRTAGIPARYVHGTCTFSNGASSGHVWVQVLIDGLWYVADPISSENSFGNVANWDTKTFSFYGTYASLPF